MIGILTYSGPHKKTQDLCYRLKALYPNDEFLLIPMPWVDREHDPVLKHRPDNAIPITAKQLGKILDISVTNEMDFTEIDFDLEMILIGGANILKGDLEKNIVINAHPGYLPNYRGLDAYKWAVSEGGPIGVTTYRIDNRVDCGVLLDRQIIEYENFYKTARKVYDLEIDMLVESIKLIRLNKYGKNLTDEHFLPGRMSREAEYKLKYEIDNGASINVGEWIERSDSLWALRIASLEALEE